MRIWAMFGSEFSCAGPKWCILYICRYNAHPINRMVSMTMAGENNGNALNTFNLNVYFRGERISLRAKEKCLLDVLIKSSPDCAPRDKIAVDVWGGGFVSDFTINQTINSLRRKINDNERALIKTKPREGYYIDKDIAELFSYDKNVVLDAIPEDITATEGTGLTTATNYPADDKTLSSQKIKNKIRKKTVQRALILISLLSACSMVGVGVGSINSIAKNRNLELYLDGIKFIIHQDYIEYINHHDKKVKCSLIERILDDGEVVITNTTRCETSG